MSKKIYLDNNASTGIDPRVINRMTAVLHEGTGNPSSIHSFGRQARQYLTEARRQVAQYLEASSHEITFTSGGTESINLALRGYAANRPGGHIITSDLEHAAVYNTCRDLEHSGHEVTFLSPGAAGAVSVELLREHIRSNTCLIAITAVNTETGIKTDIEGIAALAEELGLPLLIDAVGLLGRENFSIPGGVTAMAFSAHKVHGPKGVGVLFLRKKQRIRPQVTGGGHEYHRRAGTENLSGIVGFGEAVALLHLELPAATAHMESLRQRLEDGFRKNLSDIVINGLSGPRICNTSNISFEGVDGESLLMNLDIAGVAVSHGSACAAGALEPSRVLANMGIPRKLAMSSIRFSVSRMTTEEDIDLCVERTVEIVHRLRDVIST